MSITSTMVSSIKVGAESYNTGSETFTTDTAILVSDNISGNNVNYITSVPTFAPAKVQALWLMSDINATMTFLTSAGAAATGIPLVANTPYSWSVNSLQANPLALCGATCGGASGSHTGVAATEALLTARILLNA